MPEKVKMDLGGAVGGRFPHFLPDQNRFLYVTRGIAAGGDPEDSIRVGSLDGKTNKSLLAQQRSNAEFVADTSGSFGWLLYLRGGSVFAHRLNLRSLELEGKPVELSDSVGNAIGGTGRSLFSAHSRLLAYRVAESYSVRLVWYDASGNRLREVGEPQRRFGQIQISPDGRQALADLLVGPGQAHIESIDLLSGASTRRSFEVSSNDAVWSPDGTTIYFLGQGNNKSEIYQTAADWSSPPSLVHRSDVEIHPSDYHPVHQTLLLYTGLDRAVTLKRNASGWEPGKFPNPDEPFAKGRFSPDGRWVAYQSSTAAGGVFAMAYPPTGAKWQIWPDGEEPVWRRDGKELYFIRGQEIMAVSVDGSDRAPRFGTPRSLFRVTLPPRSIPSHRFNVAPDGKFLVMERVAEPPGVPISILLHWQSLLGKQ